MLARLQSRQTRREARAALTERFAGQQVTLRPEIVARLDELETARAGPPAGAGRAGGAQPAARAAGVVR